LIEKDTIEKINSAGYLFFQLKCFFKIFIFESLSWIAQNYTKFWGKAFDYGYKYKLGTKLSSNQQKPIIQFYDSQDIPQTYNFLKDSDVREYLRENPIRDQGDCAASWAFSTVG
jgi:hypothetical protein